MLELLIAAAALAAGVCALAWWAQERLIFFPQPLGSTAHLPARAIALDVVAADGSRLAGFLVPGESTPAPAVICFGGNAEEASWMLAEARWPRDYALVALNYRGYGKSEGDPGERALTEDALAIYDAVARRPDVDPKRIVVFGRSLGTAVAVHVAAARPVAGVILASPFDSLVAVGRQHYPWLPVSWLLKDRYDSAMPGAVSVRVRQRALPASVSMAEGQRWLDRKQTTAFEFTSRNVDRVQLWVWQVDANDSELLASSLAGGARAPNTGPLVVLPVDVEAALDREVAPGDGGRFAPSGLGVPRLESGEPIPTRQVALAHQRPRRTLWLVAHYPEASHDRLGPAVERTLRSWNPAAAGSRAASSPY